MWLSTGCRKQPSSELLYPAEPNELPECRKTSGTAGGATFFEVATGLGGRLMPPTGKKRKEALKGLLMSLGRRSRE
jgi:hypothetical protein